MSVLTTLWRLLDRRQRRELLALQLLSVLMALSTVGGIAAVLPFFAVLADPRLVERSAPLRYLTQTLHFTHGNSGGEGFLVALGIAFATLVVLANAVNLLGSIMMNRFAFRVGNALRTALFAEYLNRGLAFHSAAHSATLTSKVLHETGRVTTGILQSGLILVTNVVTVVFIVASLLFLDPLVAAAAMAGVGASYGSLYLVVRGRLLRNGLSESRYYAERTQIVGESFGAIKEILLLHAQSLFVARFARSCRDISRTIVNTLAISQSPRHVLECVTVCALVAVAVYGSGRGAGTWIGQLTFVGIAAYRLLPALQLAFAATARIRADRPALDSIAADLLAARAHTPKACTAAAAATWRGRPLEEIRLHAVSYRYAPDVPVALAEVSLRIPAGAVVGFIGDNGSGKTTLIDLLAGLLAADSGRVEVDGMVIDAANRSAWQATIAYVPQQTFLLDATLAENIALGVEPAQIDFERVRSTIGLTRLDECVAALPGGESAVLGERGCRLSGGQRQRLAIARALYRDASVLIMDEATNALDAAAERDIVDALVTQRRNRTMLLVAHRLSTLRHCDVIFELKGGRLLRSGTYQEVLARRGARALTVVS